MPNPILKPLNLNFKRKRRKSTFIIAADNKKLNKSFDEREFTALFDVLCKSTKPTESTPSPLPGQIKDVFIKPNLKKQGLEIYQDHLTKDLIKCFKELSDVVLPTDAEVKKRQLEALKKRKEISSKILLLDLDETLIHVLLLSEIKKLDISCKERVKELELLNNGESAKLHYLTRPYLQTFLENTSKYYNIWVFFIAHINSCSRQVSLIMLRHLRIA